MTRIGVSLSRAVRHNRVRTLGIVPKASRPKSHSSSKKPYQFKSNTKPIPKKESQHAHTLIDRLISEGGIKRANEKDLFTRFMADLIEKRSPSGVQGMLPRLRNMRIPDKAKELTRQWMITKYMELGGK